MVEITGIDLVKFAQKVYDLSVPQGLGFLHFTNDPLSEAEAKDIVKSGDKKHPLSMDYIKGRACKMNVYVKDGKWFIHDSWYDHTNTQYKQLLESFDIQKETEVEHGIACNCVDCQLKDA